jgi:hypothetical protein
MREKVAAAPPASGNSTKNSYVPSPAGAFGCQVCRILRELLTFVWRENIDRYKSLWAEGECHATMVGCAYLMIEAGKDESLPD